MPWCCGGSSGPPPPPPATVSSAPRRGLSRAKKPSAAEASAARPTTSGSATVALSGDADDDFDAGNRRQLPLAPPDLYGPMLLRPQKPALHVTANGSSGVEGTFVETLRQNGWSVHASSALLAPTDFERLRPVLVLLDLRLPDVADLSRTLRLLPHSDDVFFAVLYDRSISEKRRKALCQQTDVHHVISASSADIGLCDLFARLSTRLRAVPALFAVVEEADQPIEICDERNIVQYVNRAYESATGCVRDEVLGTPSSDLRRKSLRPRDLESNENLAAQGAAPSGGFQANHRRRSSEWHCITVPTSAFSSQYVYVKRGSTDAMICRDISLKSLRSQSALVDAPISEVISMLREASARCEELETQQTLREVLRMLQSSELYAPSITRFSYNDRISSGYYDGLIRLHHPSRQRKRSVVDALREKPRQGVAVEPRRRISADVKNALENEGSWSFNVLELERVSEHHPLVHLGTKLFDRWKVGETLQCSPETISKWLHMIEEHYHAGNSYHNASHAADVLQATSYFLERDRVAQHVLDTHAVAALVAATVHDLDHPGRGNAYLINTRSPLALLYNDVSVLENHHVALAFQLTLQPSLNANIFERLSRDEFTAMRQAIVEMVLATDMSRHFEFLTKFQQTVFEETGDPEERGLNSLTVCRMLIKCADIANPTRDWSLCQKWASRIVEEYFSQTAEELEKKLPVTMGLFDRRSCNVPETQSGFIKMFARETFTTWCEFAECPRLLVHLEENFKNWERLSEHWDTSLNEKIAEVTFDAP
ncbi:hypothetical protein QR680_009527 [Steinernema hermaphroditum]|uniref:Phosphodiesterase n=1 Tax=Steinernema hermaphroditum TaxID=289476 RepID=A0AA39IM06_9BILA|nr:hypothetical protein QR680_009527 [Steinernema hermaphroditum]